jgi:hypothetical protein
MSYCYGSLGVHDLKVLNDALKFFWKRLQKEATLKSWQGVDFMVPNEAEEMSRTGIQCIVGTGRKQASGLTLGCKGKARRR